MPTYNYNPAADQIVRNALQLCGVTGLGRSVKPEYMQDGRDYLSGILKGLQAFGVTLTQLVRRTLTLVPGQASYPLGTDFIDVEAEVTTLTQPTSATETYVDRMAYEDWRIISDKTINGLPTRVFIEKTSSLTAFFWSVPDAAYTWNYRGLQLLPDMSDGGQTTGLTARWTEAVTFRLAYRLSFPLNVPAERRAELGAESERLRLVAMDQEGERGDTQFMLADPYRSY